ncbi:MAG TPA: 1-deoxy-D-xylulose-5-phosphate reductoisomerase [Phycisphaerae bacterium]|nr:1-deoxy-D-xylulose-5-phosphate reductoisomerase [Phycisphaerae bacterium]HPS53026.1 1-deoxy-D-xylulose-5-phosphate reductoisomerase [Phycisphaerae bacterium]
MGNSIVILGSTGSIGRQTLDVLAGMPGLRACGLGAGGGNAELLVEQAISARPDFVAVANRNVAEKMAQSMPADTTLLSGDDALCEMIRLSKPDVIVSAVVGAAGLLPTLEGIRQGSTIALANKETLVCAGSVVMPAARNAGVSVLPVDSEHSGIFQCMLAGKSSEISKVIITSSGGSLRDWDDASAASASVADALRHPTWQMGRKITIDSATLINKTLEVIEAHWLFGLPADKLEVVIHPQSIIHAMVEFCDGSTIAQLAKPDMRLPIAYALNYPDRPQRKVAPLNLEMLRNLEFRPVKGRFRKAVELARRVIEDGACTGSVLNAANETAVEAFLAGRIKFGQIVPSIEAALDRWEKEGDTKNPQPSLDDILAADAWARKYAEKNLTTIV